MTRWGRWDYLGNLCAWWSTQQGLRAYFWTAVLLAYCVVWLVGFVTIVRWIG